MKYKLNSNLLSILSVAMHNTELDSDYMFDSYQIQSDFEDEIGMIPYTSEQFWDNYRHSKYVEHIQKLAQDVYDGTYKIRGIDVKLKLGEIYSPKYYNFNNDEIDIEVTVSKVALLEFAKENQEEFDTFLAECYSSYDGFMSLASNNYEHWLFQFKNNKDREAGAILTFLFETQIDDEVEEIMFREDFEEHVRCNTFYQEFIDPDFEARLQKEREVIENDIRHQYRTFDFDNIDLDLVEFEELDRLEVTRIIKDTKHSIDKLTAKLF